MAHPSPTPMRLCISELTKRVYACAPRASGSGATLADSNKVDLTSDFNQCVLMLAQSCGGGFSIRANDRIWEVLVREKPRDCATADPTKMAVLDYMKSLMEPVTPETLSVALGLPEELALAHLRALQKQHLIELLPCAAVSGKHATFVLAGQITAAPPAHRAGIDHAWRDRLLDGRSIERDRQGWGHHPELLDVCETFAPVPLYAALGIELHIIDSEDVLAEEHIDQLNMQQSWATWHPIPPEGEGWSLVAVFDTPDSPVAWFMRRSQD